MKGRVLRIGLSAFALWFCALPDAPAAHHRADLRAPECCPGEYRPGSAGANASASSNTHRDSQFRELGRHLQRIRRSEVKAMFGIAADSAAKHQSGRVHLD